LSTDLVPIFTERKCEKSAGAAANAEVTLFNTGTFAAVLVDRFEDLARAEALVKELKQNQCRIVADYKF